MKEKHGMSNTAMYHSWKTMIQRCENPKHKSYRNYGSRGILVCARWHSFKNFYEDMGERPKGLTLERINYNGNYEPGNCCWVTRKIQRKNSRPISCGSAKQQYFFGFNKKTGEYDENNSHHEFAKRHGLNRSNISACLRGEQQIHKGWMFEFLKTDI
jgi:hypothetical protein